MTRYHWLVLGLLIGAASSATAADPITVEQPRIRAAIEKSLPLLTKGAVGHRESRTCFACHSQGLPVLALTAAKSKGFAIDDEELKKQLAHTAKFLAGNRENYLKGQGQGGQADTAGYALWTLAAGGCSPDETTGAVAEYLLQRHQDRDHWGNTSKRPPTEATPFTTTYVALYGLNTFGTTEQAERIAKRKQQAREWLLKTPAQDNEERVFRLWGLEAAAAPAEEIAAAAKELMAKQRADGGWAQLDSGEPASAIESDAYATGTALVALHEAGGMATSDAAFQRGLAYLLKEQQDDGSWRVTTRSKPIQAYFETGFPHGKDQFISTAASSWATWALVLAYEQ
ncbi:MAG TPA: prenyltransferase/squalene oxidase repeat-containing protein [Pirellulaceae bacterium]|nr:prenyltransferase/squalene oxidase repeat-containing protein [Pirellulaceae bacterium]